MFYHKHTFIWAVFDICMKENTQRKYKLDFQKGKIETARDSNVAPTNVRLIYTNLM